jgi:hypothetical protein
MSASVQVFGRRHDESMGALKRPAIEKRPRHQIAVGDVRRCREQIGRKWWTPFGKSQLIYARQ